MAYRQVGVRTHHIEGMHLVHSRPVCVVVTLDVTVQKLRRKRVRCHALESEYGGFECEFRGTKSERLKEDVERKSFEVVKDITQTETRHPYSHGYAGQPDDKLLNILGPGNILNQDSKYLKHLCSLLT